MKTMKEAGSDEVRRVKQRALRTRAMGRINEEDCEYIVKRCDEIESRIQQMYELDPRREEF